jgi:hypothetical protein
MLTFELGQKDFKDRVSKLSIKNPKTIFPTISILQYLSWTYVGSPIFEINDKNISNSLAHANLSLGKLSKCHPNRT